MSIRDMIKTSEGIQELAYILSIPVDAVEKVAKRLQGENEQNSSEQIIEDTL